MAEPEDVKPEETTTEPEEPEVVAHSAEDEAVDDWCVFNLSKL